MHISGSDAAIIRHNKILLVQQRTQSDYGLWGLPGGHVEVAETPEQAVIREIKEELGVALKRYKLFRVYETTKSANTLTLNTFTGTLDGAVKLNDDELLAYGWFSLESVEAMKDKLRVPNVLQQVRDAFAA